ncbi:MAG TPA: GNAT family protein [Actinomycetota bacterium]
MTEAVGPSTGAAPPPPPPGPRLRLRPVRRDDLALLRRWISDPEAASFNWFGFISETRWQQDYDENGLLSDDHGNLIVEIDVATGPGGTPTPTPIGDVSYYTVRYGPNTASRCHGIGIHLTPEWRGHGYGTEAQRQLAAYLFATTTIERLEAATDVDNLAEQRSLEKAGFTREATIRQASFREGSWHDLALYRRLRGDQAG